MTRVTTGNIIFSAVELAWANRQKQIRQAESSGVVLSLSDIEEAIATFKLNPAMLKGTKRNRIASLNALAKFIMIKSIIEGKNPYEFVFTDIEADEFVRWLINERNVKFNTLKTYASSIKKALKTFYTLKKNKERADAMEELKSMLDEAIENARVLERQTISERERITNLLDTRLDKLIHGLNKTLDFLIDERGERGRVLATALILQFCTASRATEINNVRYHYKERVLELEINKRRTEGINRWKYVPLNEDLHKLLMSYVATKTSWHPRTKINDYTHFKDSMRNINERITVIDTENDVIETITYLFYKDINREFNTEKLRSKERFKNGMFITPRFVRRASRGLLFTPLVGQNKSGLFLYAVGQTSRELEINKTYQNPLDFVDAFRDELLAVQQKLCDVINLKERLAKLIG